MGTREDIVVTLQRYCERYSDYSTLHDMEEDEDPLDGEYSDICFSTGITLFDFLSDNSRPLLLETTKSLNKEEYLHFLTELPWKRDWVAYLEIEVAPEMHGVFLLNMPRVGIAAVVQSLGGIYKATAKIVTPEELRDILEHLYDEPRRLAPFISCRVGNVDIFNVATPLPIKPELLPTFTREQEEQLYVLRKHYLEKSILPRLRYVLQRMNRYAGKREPDVAPYLRALNALSKHLLGL